MWKSRTGYQEKMERMVREEVRRVESCLVVVFWAWGRSMSSVLALLVLVLLTLLVLLVTFMA